MQSISKRVFTHEYRAEAVKLVTEQGMGITDAAKKLALSVKTYSRWAREERAGTLLRVDTHRVQPVTDLQAEVSRLKRELAVACEERDILKKATALLLERAAAICRLVLYRPRDVTSAMFDKNYVGLPESGTRGRIHDPFACMGRPTSFFVAYSVDPVGGIALRLFTETRIKSTLTDLK